MATRTRCSPAWVISVCAAAFLLVALLTHARAADLYDPALTWRTVVSPRFAVHYHAGGRNLAVRVSRIAEEAIDQLRDLFGYAPEGRIEIVIADNSDLVNGYAQVMPKNTVRLFLTAPTEHTGLSTYDDWIRILVVHELAHVCDIDQTWGITRFLRWIFGSYIAMNGFTPQFLSEGVAVYAETLLTRTGRGRSPYVDMILRMAALDDRFVAIDQAHIQYSDWPGPTSAYFFGGHFHLWLADRFGGDAVRDLHQFNAAMPLPYIYWPGAEVVFGDSLPDLWDAWHDEVRVDAQAVRDRIVEQGVTESRRITYHGRNITGSRYSPDGTYIIYSRTSPVDGATVRRVGRDGTDDRFLVLQTFSPRFAFTPDGKSFFYSQNAINKRFNDYNDLYRYDVDDDEVTKLKDSKAPKSSLRARDPDISPDGQRLVFVQNKLHQSWISVATISGEKRDSLTLQTLVGPRGDMQHASPRFSPDGATIVASTWFEGGERDIVLYDAQTGELLRRITADRALDASPEWSPDGRYVLYESDHSGIFNIYAYDIDQNAYFQVTRVVGGAFQPDVSSDGKSMIFRNASGIGFDIHEIPFDPGRWEPLAYDPEVGYRPLSAAPATAPAAEAAAEVRTESVDPEWATVRLSPPLLRVNEAPLALRTDEHDEAYSIWPTLLPFQDNWILMPAVYFYQADPSVILTTMGADVLRKHLYAASVGSSYYGRDLNWSAAYVNDVWYPSVSIAGGEVTFARRVEDGKHEIENIRSASVGVSWPILRRHLLGVSYVNQPRRLRYADSVERNTFAWIQLGYTYFFARRYPFSVGQEHGRSVSVAGRIYNKNVGCSFDEVLLTADGRAYVNNPLFDNHVLALRLVGAVALGPDYKETFYLGGNRGASIFTVEAERSYALRGYTPRVGKGRGTGLLAAYAEYRFPLFHVERGLWTVPVYLERIHMAVFTEGGNTFGNGTEGSFTEVRNKAWRRMQGGQVGAGAELRVDIKLGWAFPLTLRFGAAQLVVKNGKPTKGAPLSYILEVGSAI